MLNKTFALLISFIVAVSADCYLQNPRGSNNRVNEANQNRNNANRLFDSQNNGAGGYCLGPPMQFYEGSLLTIEWTVQHGCGNPKLWCNIVIQYMCGTTEDSLQNLIRDGSTTDTIPDDQAGVTAMDGNNGPLYGMHENLAYYEACTTRNRNLGLWISDREQEGGLNQGRRAARFTRQNNNGNRNGLECPEERDYYPYWHPTPWRDIAVLTESTRYCRTYRSQSQNVRAKNQCVDANGVEVEASTEAECAGMGEWISVDSWGIGAPACVLADWSRDNHLGNGMTGFMNSYNWTLPTSVRVPNPNGDGTVDCISEQNCVCVLRIRYNISTTDTNVNLPGLPNLRDANNIGGNFIDFRWNGDNSPVIDDEIVFQDGLPHELAIDTTQYGRTFQDRSHTFTIIPRSQAGLAPSDRVFNLNVRGKRGNIVQTYPAHEYDFVPPILHVFQGDYIHFQWTGCDTNPNGNAGEGTAQTDRSNIVQIQEPGHNYPASDDFLRGSGNALFPSNETRRLMAYIGQDLDNCHDRERLLADNNNNNNQAEQDVNNCMKLNAAPTPYFNGGAVQMNTVGSFHYMSSRNNNFTNRGQKATIMTSLFLPVYLIVFAVLGGLLCLCSFAALGLALFARFKDPESNHVAKYINII